MKKLLLSFMVLMPFVSAWAQDVESGSLTYSILSEENHTVSLKRLKESFSGNLVIPNSVNLNSKDYTVKEIADSAFSKCTGMTSISIPSSVDKVGKASFNQCTSLKNLTIEDGDSNLSLSFQSFNSYVSDLWGYMASYSGLFSACPLENVYIGRNLDYVELETEQYGTKIFDSSPFYGKDKLKKVTLGGSISSLPNYFFYKCNKLSEIVINATLRQIGTSAFADCSALTSVYINDVASWCGVQCANAEASPFNSFSTKLYVNGDLLTSLVIPSTVTEVGDYAFYKYSGIKSVDLGNVSTIGTYAFYATYLNELTLPATITEIKPYAFWTTQVDTLRLPESLVNVGSYAFSLVNNLYVSTSVPPTIGEKAFGSNCTVHVPSYSCVGAYKKAPYWALYNYVAESNEGIIEVNVKTPGTLSSRLLLTEVEFADIYALKITGKLNNEDWQIIKNNLTNLLYLDIAETDVIAIPAQQFMNSPINEVILPACTKAIGGDAFKSSRLNKINLPDSLQVIGTSAFESSLLAGTVTIPASVSSLGSRAFYHTNIEGFVVQKGCSRIPQEVCSMCSKLTMVDIPSSVMSIETKAFIGTNLNVLKIHHTTPPSMSTGSNDAFSDLAKANVTLYVPLYASSKYMNDSYWSAFHKIRELYANIQVTVTTTGGEVRVGEDVVKKLQDDGENPVMNVESELYHDVTVEVKPNFGYCVDKFMMNGEEVTLSADGILNIDDVDDNYNLSVSFIKEDIVVDGLQYVLLSEEKKTCKVVKGSVPYSGDIVIPDSISYQGVSLGVAEIDADAFRENTAITSVVIPNTVSEIKEFSFYNCSGLKSIKIGSSVKTIPFGTFAGCKNVSTLIYAEGCTTTFNVDLTSITSVSLPNSLKTIASFSFAECKSLSVIDIPASVTQIYNDAFKNAGLETINVSEDNIFYASVDGVLFTKYLTSIEAYPRKKAGVYEIPNSVSSIGKYAFYGYQADSIVIPSNVRKIYDNAFAYSRLKSVTIPDGVTSISAGTFSSSNLQSINLPNSVTSIGDDAFANCSRLEAITIPESVTTIGLAAFNYCSKLSSLYIPNSVQSIGGWAFQGCTSLTTLTISEGVTSIEFYAFGNCSALTSIYNYAKTPQEPSSGSLFSTYTATLHVLPGYKEVYESSNEWKKFTIVDDIDPVGIKGVEKTIDDGGYTIYDVKGNICPSLVRGLNIIRYNDGHVKKIMIK